MNASRIGPAHLREEQAAWRVRLATQPLLAALLLFSLAVLLALTDIDHLPSTDELYHVLAAKGWLSEGVPRIGDGVYDRAQLFTVLTAWSFQLLGESFVVARLLPLVAGGLLVVAVFLWTRSTAGNLAAWIAALFLCLSPLTIELMQFVRFYSLHALIFWLAAIGTYALVTQAWTWSRSLPLACGVVLAFLAAAHLQVLTLIGAAGILLWAALVLGLPWLAALRGSPMRFWACMVALGIVLVLAVGVAQQTGLAADLLERYRFVPLNFKSVQNEFWFYHVSLLQSYPVLWGLFPFIALVAVAARPRPALFCCIVFVTATVLLSLGGMKTKRYLFFVLPLLFVLWGIALASLLEFLRRWVVDITDRALAGAAPGLPRRPARWTVIASAALFVIFAHGAAVKTLLIPFGLRLSSGGDGAVLTSLEVRPDWGAARLALVPMLESADTVLTTLDLYPLYYFGRGDILVNRNRLSQIEGGEFARDPRTGRPVVSTADSLNLILDCYADGMLVTSQHHWESPWIVDQAMIEVIERRTVPVELPSSARLKAFRWERPDRGQPAVACDSMPPPLRPNASVD